MKDHSKITRRKIRQGTIERGGKVHFTRYVETRAYPKNVPTLPRSLNMTGPYEGMSVSVHYCRITGHRTVPTCAPERNG